MGTRTPERDGRDPVKLLLVPRPIEPAHTRFVPICHEQTVHTQMVGSSPRLSCGVAPLCMRVGISLLQYLLHQALDHTASSRTPPYLQYMVLASTS